MVRILVKYISTVTFYITGVTGYVYSQMMLCYDFDRKMILKNFNFRMIFQSSDQTILNFSSGIVLINALQLLNTYICGYPSWSKVIR